MNDIADIASDAVRTLLQENNIIQNYLDIPLIEIEQLNPRIKQLNGIMVVKYYAVGDENEEAVQYEYEWDGGDLVFTANPFPRRPQGTGQVSLFCS